MSYDSEIDLTDAWDHYGEIDVEVIGCFMHKHDRGYSLDPDCKGWPCVDAELVAVRIDPLVFTGDAIFDVFSKEQVARIEYNYSEELTGLIDA